LEGGQEFSDTLPAARGAQNAPICAAFAIMPDELLPAQIGGSAR
jgi:hypothetical protein